MSCFCELDKAAIKSYTSIHTVDESLNLGDITKIDPENIPKFNMICGGSPCQSFSLNGKQQGSLWECKSCGHKFNPIKVNYDNRDCCEKCGSYDIHKSESSLIIEWLRMVRINKPIWGIYENVKNLVDKFKETFDLFIDELHDYGYNTYYKVLNSSDYGLPQNRNRVYLIIILKEYDNGKFEFPTKLKDDPNIEDILDEYIDNKYYVEKNKLSDLIIGYSDNYDSIYIKQATKSGYIECPNNGCFDSSFPKSKTRRGRVQKNGKCAPTIMASKTSNLMIYENTKIRRLTPIEYWKLQGFSLVDFVAAKIGDMSKAQYICSNFAFKEIIEYCENNSVSLDSDLYKQAGNSISVNVLFHIYKSLFVAMPYLFYDLKVGSFFSGIGAFESALDMFYKCIN